MVSAAEIARCEPASRERAASIIGARLYLEDLEDTRIPESDPTVGIIERVIAEFAPTLVYTHTIHDVHQDHRNVNRASLVAARRVAGVYCYQSPSATVDYKPARFVSIEPYLDGKIAAIGAFKSQTDIRDYLDDELIRATARYWGRFGDAAVLRTAGGGARPFRPQSLRTRRAGGRTWLTTRCRTLVSWSREPAVLRRLRSCSRSRAPARSCGLSTSIRTRPGSTSSDAGASRARTAR